jgi:hypothetical protein
MSTIYLNDAENILGALSAYFETSPVPKSLRILAACAVLVALAACAAPSPPAPVITAPPPKPLDAKTQLENHM